MDAIDTALNRVNIGRGNARRGAEPFRNAISNIQITAENLTAARGRIVDADFAMETANLSRASILQQAGTAMVAQANQLPTGAALLGVDTRRFGAASSTSFAADSGMFGPSPGFPHSFAPHEHSVRLKGTRHGCQLHRLDHFVRHRQRPRRRGHRHEADGDRAASADAAAGARPDIQTKISAFGSLTTAESSFRDAALPSQSRRPGPRARAPPPTRRASASAASDRPRTGTYCRRRADARRRRNRSADRLLPTPAQRSAPARCTSRRQLELAGQTASPQGRQRRSTCITGHRHARRACATRSMPPVPASTPRS